MTPSHGAGWHYPQQETEEVELTPREEIASVNLGGSPQDAPPELGNAEGSLYNQQPQEEATEVEEHHSEYEATNG